MRHVRHDLHADHLRFGEDEGDHPRRRYVYAEHSVRVYVTPCPTGDSILDKEATRKLLDTLWSQAHTNLPAASRIERGGYVLDSSGTDIDVPSAIDSVNDTPCANTNARTRQLPVVASAHVHPFRPGIEPIPWQQCKWTPPPPGYIKVTDPTWGGPSAPDWVRTWVDHKPGIVIDGDSLYIFGPPDSLRAIPNPKNPSDSIYVPAGNWRAKIKSYPKKTGTCQRP